MPKRIRIEAVNLEVDRSRAAGRATVDYFLRTLNLIGRLQPGDLILSLVQLTILAGNIGHIDRAGAGGDEFADATTPVPDDMRRPVSVLYVSTALGLPYETTRRYVGQLLDSGVCARSGRGVIVPASALTTGSAQLLILENAANLRRLVRHLKAIGFDLN